MSYISTREEFLIFAATSTSNFDELVENYITAEFIIKGNDVGSATIVMPGPVPVSAGTFSNPGDQLLLKMCGPIRYGTPTSTVPRIRLSRIVPAGSGQAIVNLFSGDLVRLEESDSATEGPLVTLTYESDERYLASSVVKPQPASSAPPYSTSVSDNIPVGASTTLGSTAMIHYVTNNCGASAAPSSRNRLTVAADPLIGTSVRTLGRWQNLLAFLNEIADASGLMFQVIDKVFTVLPYVLPRSGISGERMEFTKLDGTLRTITRFDAAPAAPGTGNYFYLGGAGTGTGRTIYEYNDTANVAKWGLVEQFIDRSDINDTLSRDTAFKTALAQRTNFGVAIEVRESAHGSKYVYGGSLDASLFGGYGLGHVVWVRYGPDDSQVVSDVVRGCRITFNEDGTTVVAPTVGRDNPLSPDVFGTIDLYGAQIREVQRA